MPRPRNCRLCGEPLSKNKRPQSKYCNEYERLLASKLRRDILNTFQVERLLRKRTKTIEPINVEVLQPQ